MRRPCLSLLAIAAAAVQPTNALASQGSGTAEMTRNFIQRARSVMMTSPAKAMVIGHQMESAMKGRESNPERIIGMSRAKWIIGEASLRMNRTDEARRYIDEAYALAQRGGNAQAVGDSLLSRGSLRGETGDAAGALTDFLTAYRMFQKSDDRRSQSIVLQYLSGINSDAANYERAKTYLRQAAEVYKTDPLIQISLGNNIGNILVRLGRDEEAEAEFKRAAALAHATKEYALEIPILTNMSRGQINRGDMVGASRSIAAAKRVSRMGNIPIDDQIMVAEARYEFARHNLLGARKLMLEAIKFGPKDKNIQAYKELHQTAYTVFRATGDVELALEHLEIARRLKDEAMELTVSTKSALISAQFDYANQELRISKLRARALRRSVDDAQTAAHFQRNVFVGICLTTLLIIALLMTGVIVLRRSRNDTRRANDDLAQVNTALEQAMVEVKEREKAERQATNLAEHDALTGLHNRRYLYENLYSQVVERAGDDASCCVLLLDLDRFKPINDIHGHEVGDAVLIEAGNRLRLLAAKYDATPVRLGGDEFVILLASIDADERAKELAAEIIRDISAPYEVADRRLTVGTSIGISNDERDGSDIDMLLRAADIAMYEAKRSGRGTYRFFDGDMEVRIRNRADMETDMRSALRADEIQAHFQPIYNFEAGRITGFEALARWTHAQRGPIGPDEFIPLAEETGMIDEITMAVLRQSCRAASLWPDDVTVSINLSPVLLKDAGITDRIFDVISSEAMAPERLIIEITENAVIDDLNFASALINTFRAAGIRIALDDFGKGYSSLSHLRQLAFDHLKLDSSFVRTLGEGDSMKIATAVAGLARAMEMPVTAEGVETAEAARQLRQLGFSYAQGYFYGKAMTAGQARIVIENQRFGEIADQAA